MLFRSPFLLRTVDPPLSEAAGRKVTALERVGKRIAIGLGGELWLVLHLMIAGRLHWLPRGAKRGGTLSRRGNFAAFDFSTGSLLWSEAGSEKRASLHVVRGRAGLASLDPGGLEVMDCDPAAFRAALRAENHTLKRALTDPTLVSGIGNAYSDEILWEARLSPVALTQKLTDQEIARLLAAVRTTLGLWIERLGEGASERFPEKVTAFRPEMAVHGKYRRECPRCGGRVERIRYASSETNYCPTCQTGGRLLADRALSRLLGEDWPKTQEQLEMRMRPRA